MDAKTINMLLVGALVLIGFTVFVVRMLHKRPEPSREDGVSRSRLAPLHDHGSFVRRFHLQSRREPDHPRLARPCFGRHRALRFDEQSGESGSRTPHRQLLP